VLASHHGRPRDIVVLNAAAALLAAGKATDPRAAARLATEAIDDGVAADLLARLVTRTNA
jgi:anthranilate phosphoribosyltransferase